MSKTSRLVPEGKFYLKDKADKTGKQPIYIRYTIGSRHIRKYTGYKVYPEDWDKDRQVVASRAEKAKEINLNLKILREEFDKKIFKDKDNLTPNMVRNIVHGAPATLEEKGRKQLLIPYLYEYNKMLYNEGKITYKSYINKESCINVFERFLKHTLKMPGLTLFDISIEIIDKFVEYRKSVLDNKSNESINKALTPIYRALAYASDCGLVPRPVCAPFFNHYLPVKKTRHLDEDDEKIRFLTESQLSDLILYYKNCNRIRTREFLDLFFFSFYACGIRFSDIMTLKWDNLDLEKKILTKKQYKTNVPISIPLSPKAMDIVLSWKNKKSAIKSEYVFKMLSKNDLRTERSLEMKKNSLNKTINTSLRCIGEKLGFPFSLTMHVARHTFAVMSINGGMDLKVLSTLMGHTSILTTEKTYATVLQKTVDEQVREKTSFYDKFDF